MNNRLNTLIQQQQGIYSIPVSWFYVPISFPYPTLNYQNKFSSNGGRISPTGTNDHKTYQLNGKRAMSTRLETRKRKISSCSSSSKDSTSTSELTKSSSCKDMEILSVCSSQLLARESLKTKCNELTNGKNKKVRTRVGRKCGFEGCQKGARGKTDFCIRHGGGRRCSFEGCDKSAIGKSDLCVNHGGGRRCLKDGCTRAAQGSTPYCVGHGGGRRCQIEGCTKGARARSIYCWKHKR